MFFKARHRADLAEMITVREAAHLLPEASSASANPAFLPLASELRFLGGPRHAPNSEYCEDSEWPYGAGENLSGFWLQFVGWRVGFLGLPDKSLVN